MSITDIPWDQKHDMSKIVGTDVTADTYSKVPVSTFGLKMLQQMGWDEKKGVGKNTANALLVPIENIQRPSQAGLGSIPTLVSSSGRAYRSIDEKVVLSGIQLFSEIRVISGKYKNLQGVVTEISRDDKEQVVNYVVQLKLNGQNVKLSKEQVCEEKDIIAQPKKSRSRSKEVEGHLKWVVAGIRVKVKSKSYMNGTIYNKKIKISDVLDECHFLAICPDGSIVDDLREKDIKPILPSKGGRVVILKGGCRNEIGVFEEKVDKKNVRVGLLGSNDSIVLRKRDVCSII